MKAIQSCCASYLFYITSCICSDLESLGSTCWLFLADTCIQRSPCKYSLVWNITCSWYSCSVQSITKWQSTHEELCWQSRVALLLLMERGIFCILTSFLWICNKIISFLLELHFKLFRKTFFFPSLCWWIWWEGLLKVFVQNGQEFQQLQIIFALLSVNESTWQVLQWCVIVVFESKSLWERWIPHFQQKPCLALPYAAKSWLTQPTSKIIYCVLPVDVSSSFSKLCFLYYWMKSGEKFHLFFWATGYISAEIPGVTNVVVTCKFSCLRVN